MSRQREIIEQWAAAQGHTVVGWAEDLDVSGSVDPFDTPAFGPWLNHRAEEWDIVCAWKLDRLGRNAIQLSRLFGWALDHGKTVVSASESIDLSTWVGRLVANVIAGVAEGELEAIRERQRASRSKLRQIGRWPGGKPPYGYRAVPNEDQPGYRLDIDEDAKAVVRRIVDGVLDGATLASVAAELNADDVDPPARHYARLRANGGPVTASVLDGRWQATPIKNMLRSKALLGYAHHHGETVRDEAGLPVRLAEPLITTEEWERVQATLAGRRGNYRRGDASPLSGLVVCALCGEQLRHDRTEVKRPGRTYAYRYYRCRNRCSAMLPAEDMETLAEEAFLEQLGDTEIREKVWIPGDSREADLREAVTALEELVKAAGRAKSATAKQRLQAQLGALDERIAELESAPSVGAHWEYRGTGVLYRSVWGSADAEARRKLLRQAGITIAASRVANAITFEIRVDQPAQ
jgi:DNA invertase Pin-like site-specific DNA recombinase